MNVRPADDPVLARYRRAPDDLSGERIERVVLFGSRARDSADDQSDYDIALFLKSMPDRSAELDRLARLRVDFLDQTGAFFDTLPYLAAAYPERTPLMHEVRREGIVL